MNVGQVIETILTDSCGDFRLENTCDQLMSGSPDTEVTGIVTTFMATVEVIRQAKACGANLIVAHEPTYFTGPDRTDWLESDPVYEAKKRLIEENGIAIWRFHDHMHIAKAKIDRIYEGLLKEIGWENRLLEPRPPHTYEIDETSLADLARFFKQKLGMDVIRVVGNPEMRCSRVGILVGGGSLGLGREQMPMELMRFKNLDVVVCGEITEWTLCAYVNDARMLGLKKGMIVVGHERTEEWGMKWMAKWLKPLVGGVPVRFVDAKEPFVYL